jgi:ankyrin repeat protein
MNAANSGHNEIIDLLLSNGANINDKNNDGYTVLMKALNHYDTLKYLIDNGADINAKNNDGDTLLIKMASKAIHFKYESDGVRSDFFKSIRLILDSGADISARDNKGETALIAAYEYDKMLNLLISNGADINAQNNNGQTALMLASKGNYRNSAEFLIKNGADINKKDNLGRKALWYAKYCYSGCKSTVKLIESYGGSNKAENPYEHKFKCIGFPVDESYTISKRKKEEILIKYDSDNNILQGFFRKDEYCKPVLITKIRTVYYKRNVKGDIGFKKKILSSYPDIILNWKTDKNKNTVFFWNGQQYEMEGLKESRELNEEALKLYKQSKLKEAISIWENAYNLAIMPNHKITVNAEVINNLGFAYYKLAKKENNDMYFDKAEKYLKEVLIIDGTRWLTYLNLGDLYSERGNHKEAIKNYRRLLEIKPDYNYANNIKNKIRELNNEIEERAKENYDLFEQKIHPFLPKFSFKVYWYENRYEMVINIFKAKENNLFQSIKGLSVESAWKERYFQFEDINFDGYKDIKILESWGATGNEHYKYLLYNPSKDKFYADEAFQFNRPELFPKIKQIHTHRNRGSAGSEFYDQVYKVRDGNPILIKVIEQTYDSKKGYFRKIVRELIDGELKVTADDIDTSIR